MPLLFLMRLFHTPLPVRVVQAEEIRHVSVLVATGLIEARITPLPPRGPYLKSTVATVTRITEEGLAEIAKMDCAPRFPKNSMRFARGLRLM
ncbi:hypothetical protein EJO66_22400 [Variovorax beijingensis]|uniref:Uncharacterized protein n=1 Tax=Variovorax beijingensis TaxID=2496117 RepID=A0ABY0A1K7_9BURK|nr:hypothetical protein [Variovorax beijingensis]RSZ32004.1 hypothetical protein EJO66_22400 [Variovorax beijingensis]